MVKRQPERQYSEYPENNLHNENWSTIKIQTDIGENPPKSDGADETGDFGMGYIKEC